MRIDYRKSKQAAGDAISALILFIAVLSVSLAVVVGFQQFVVQTQGGLTSQQDSIVNKLQTNLIISNVVYDNSQEELIIFVRNVGETTLDTTLLNFFVNTEFGSGLDIVNANTGVQNRVFTPQDTIRVEFPITLSSGTHELLVVSEFGNVVRKEFNVN